MASDDKGGLSPPGRGRAGSPRPYLIWIALATFGIYLYPVVLPFLVQDDFQILAQSGTWQRTCDGLWVPQNEHAMPLGRLLTFVLRRVSPITVLPWTAGLVGPLALLAALPLLYLFVKRELTSPFCGLVACALFGITSVYQQAVFWFAASFSVFVLDTLLLGLLAAQHWRQHGGVLWLVLTATACFIAPCWFASGTLVGPLCCLYLLAGCRGKTGVSWTRLLLQAITPLIGTGLFLLICLPRTASLVFALHGGRSIFDVLDLRTGLVFTCRSIVDNLVVGLFGISTAEVPIVLVVVILVVLAGAVVWWWQQSVDGRLIVLGAGLIGSAYLLVYSARAELAYEGALSTPTWSRYHLLPQLGLALIVSGGLNGRRLGKPVVFGERLSPRQVRVLASLIIVLFVVQLPRGVVGTFICPPGLQRLFGREKDPINMNALIEQRKGLALIAEVDRRCRERSIDAEGVVRTLPPLRLAGWYTDPNGWMLLQGSPHPQPATEEEIKALLDGLASPVALAPAQQ